MEKEICQGDNLKRTDNVDREELLYNGSYKKAEAKQHQLID